jgi:hypothetical protein
MIGAIVKGGAAVGRGAAAVGRGAYKVGSGAARGIGKAKTAASRAGAVLPSGPAGQGASAYLPPVAKSALGIAATAAIIYFAYKLIKAPSKIGANAGNKAENKDAAKELDRIANTATLSNSQAAVIANALFTAMDGYGTDETGIVNQFKKVKNNADFLKVQTAFGTRTISSGRFNPEPNYKGTMAGALGSELSAYYTALINRSLKSRGVTYQI